MNIRISDEVHAALVKHLSEDRKLSKFTEQAIKEKIERENELKNNPCPKTKK